MIEPHIHGPTGGSNHQALPGSIDRNKKEASSKKAGTTRFTPKKALFFLDPPYELYLAFKKMRLSYSKGAPGDVTVACRP